MENADLNSILSGIKLDGKDCWVEQMLLYDIPHARREGEGRKKCYYGTPYFLGKYDIGKEPRKREFEPKAL